MNDVKDGLVALAAIVTVGIAVDACEADFIGWTSTVREVEGGRLVNVFAVTNSAGDRLVNVYGGGPSQPGRVSTNSPGGFLQGPGARGAFRPDGGQPWTDLDSFLTIGGGFDATSQAWSANASTLGDPGWLFAGGGGAMIDGFSALDGAPGGPTNPWTNDVPTGAGWYALAGDAAARDLASLAAVRQAYSMMGGVAHGASSAAAASGAYGVLVGQLYVADLERSMIQWRMGATIQRLNGTIQQAEFEFTVGQVPAPGGVAALVAIFAGGSRRRRRD